MQNTNTSKRFSSSFGLLMQHQKPKEEETRAFCAHKNAKQKKSARKQSFQESSSFGKGKEKRQHKSFFALVFFKEKKRTETKCFCSLFFQRKKNAQKTKKKLKKKESPWHEVDFSC
jgi:hypothetical protein